MHNDTWRVRGMALALIYLVVTLLTVGIDALHMHPDEHLVYFFTRNDLGFLVNYLAQQDSHPPLWFSSFWLWRQFAGESEFAGRFYSVLLTALTLTLVYRLGRRWFGMARSGLFAVALLGVNALFFNYALEIRPYALIMLLVTLSMWFLQRWLTRGGWRSALGYGVTVAAMLYVHYFLFVLLLVQGGCWLAVMLRRPSRRLLAQAVGAAGLALLLWLPWMPSALYQVQHVRSAEIAGGNERGLVGAGSTTVPTSWTAVTDLANMATNGYPLLYGAVLVFGVLALWRRGAWWLVLAWALGVPGLSLLLNFVVAVYTPRYVVSFVIGLTVAVGAALAVSRRPLRETVLAGVVVLSLAALPASLPDNRPLRDIYTEVSAAARPGDAILFDQADIESRFVQWQVQHYLDPALYANRVYTVDEALAYRRVWYAADQYLNRPDAQSRFRELERTHPLQRVVGACGQGRPWCYLIQLLEAPPQPDGQAFGAALMFHGVDVDAVSRGAITTRLWWSVADRPALDYSIGLQLLDANGGLIAQADGPIRDQYSDMQPLETSQMLPERYYIDHRTLALPPDVRAGDYQLMLVVYQSWDGVRLTLPNGADSLRLQIVTIPAE